METLVPHVYKVWKPYPPTFTECGNLIPNTHSQGLLVAEEWKRERKMLVIVDTCSACNAQGQRKHFAQFDLTNLAHSLTRYLQPTQTVQNNDLIFTNKILDI